MPRHHLGSQVLPPLRSCHHHHHHPALATATSPATPPRPCHGYVATTSISLFSLRPRHHHQHLPTLATATSSSPPPPSRRPCHHCHYPMPRRGIYQVRLTAGQWAFPLSFSLCFIIMYFSLAYCKFKLLDMSGAIALSPLFTYFSLFQSAVAP